MHLSIWNSGLKPELQECNTCCRGLFHCPLCPTFSPAVRAKIEEHLSVHIKNALPFKDKMICRCRLPCRTTGHFHCPVCNLTIIRRGDMARHLLSCQHSSIPSQPPLSGLLPAELSEEPRIPPAVLFEEPRLPPKVLSLGSEPFSDSLLEHSYALPSAFNKTAADGKSMNLTCPHCGLTLRTKNYKAHMMRKHSNQSIDVCLASHLQCVCVDETTGLFAVQRTGHGFSVPVHVQRKTWGVSHNIRCELEECQQYQLLAQRSGLGFSLCEHLRSLDYCRETVKEVFLQEHIVMEMVDLKFFGEAKAATCIKRQKAAQMAHAPLCVRVDFGGSSTQICLSVFEPEIHSFCRLGRIFVTYNALRNTWHCACAKPRISCPHKNIAKWHLFQTQRDIFKSTVPLSSGTPSQMTQESSSFEDNAAVERSIRYIFKEKKIPGSLPENVISQKMDHQKQLFPCETLCQVCPEHPKLDEAVLVTNKARIVSMMGVIENVSTHHRSCPRCHMVYRYQEWTDGLHNFDNHVVLSLELCLFLRENLQNHVSASRVIDSLEGLRRVKFPSRDTIFHAYCHFEALTDAEYMYSCINCGFHPPVVVMDLHRKGVFKLAVSDLKAPEDFNGEHDIEGFWNSIHLEMISRGFFPSGVKNPFSVPPSYTHWAPWIGSETRTSDIVLNTEFKKVGTSSSHEAKLSSVTEDRLLDELAKQKVGVVRKLCKACNIDSKGSRFDLITRLRENDTGETGDTEPQKRVDNKKANRRSTDATFPDPCGPPCEALTKPENILASRSSWCFVPHPGQQQLLNYVLDISRPKDELIVETSSGCLTRSDFWTLGLNKEMESTIGNGCFELITKIVQSKGISIYIENLYVTRTWLAPYGCDPLRSFPTDAQRMDIIVLPLWTPGHFQLCESCSEDHSRAVVRKKEL
ncbi:uncharacterized protein LOC113008408 isoform X1 [Astatotilapia calliptera]|uniref:uncharacterized protein LOC113008408 isoform X1 n=1 Tax=Astatotilapia calliptera TaxID=8154 RepID=UPI000E4274AD|nr:uncharacterized protein LOC113008408 isoform X1 [Astatotilapia calliptera]XP_026001570.1 uncharacterized protein LOC113008408 isoform X1 [Astatotilapia calliptera]